MTPQEAEALATATLAAIDRPDWPKYQARIKAADRERVTADLAGLRTHIPSGDPDYGCEGCGMDNPCDDERRYADGLRRTAALYGITP